MAMHAVDNAQPLLFNGMHVVFWERSHMRLLMDRVKQVCCEEQYSRLLLQAGAVIHASSPDANLLENMCLCVPVSVYLSQSVSGGEGQGGVGLAPPL